MNEMSVVGLLLNASVPVQIVMLLLMIASLMSLRAMSLDPWTLALGRFCEYPAARAA